VCLRDQGIDVSDRDPVTSDISDLDKDDPGLDAAYEACYSALSRANAPQAEVVAGRLERASTHGNGI